MLIVKKWSWPIYERFLNEVQEHAGGKIVTDRSELSPSRIQPRTEKHAPRRVAGSPLGPQSTERSHERGAGGDFS